MKRGIARFSKLFVSLSCLCYPCLAQQQQVADIADMVTAETSTALDLGLQFLAQRQLDDGSFGTMGYSRNVAVCALAGLAFQASGSTPQRGPYAEYIDRCIEYVMAHTSESGFIAAPDAMSRGPMYGHGFALLFLCENHGMAAQPELRNKISRAVEVIVRSQNDEGGWRYQPEPSDADISVTVCQMMALRAARNAGIAVPQQTIKRGLKYVKDCQNQDGGFRYMLQPNESQSQFARSAAALVAILHAGEYQSEQLQRGLGYVRQFKPGQNRSGDPSYYFYGHYYAAQAMWHTGGEPWKEWFPAVRDELIARQRGNGSWVASICPEYGTAMACIVLQIPNNSLPILQR